LLGSKYRQSPNRWESTLHDELLRHAPRDVRSDARIIAFDDYDLTARHGITMHCLISGDRGVDAFTDVFGSAGVGVHQAHLKRRLLLRGNSAGAEREKRRQCCDAEPACMKRMHENLS
jgi:hypothetical protein